MTWGGHGGHRLPGRVFHSSLLQVPRRMKDTSGNPREPSPTKKCIFHNVFLKFRRRPKGPKEAQVASPPQRTLCSAIFYKRQGHVGKPRGSKEAEPHKNFIFHIFFVEFRRWPRGPGEAQGASPPQKDFLFQGIFYKFLEEPRTPEET